MHVLRNYAERNRFENEARKQMRHTHTQCNNNQGILGIVSGLHRVVPAVEYFNEGANQADEQNQRDDH